MGYSGNLYATATEVITTKGDLRVGDSSGNPERLSVGTNGYVLAADSTASDGIAWLDAGSITHSVAMEIAASDQTTALTVADDKVTFRMPYGLKLNNGIAGVRASLTTAGTTSGVTTIDIEMNGSSILSTLLTLDYTEKTSVSAATPVVISVADNTLTDNAEMTVNVDVLSGGATEAGLKIQLIGTLI